MPGNQSDLERDVMRMLLVGDHPVFSILREQYLNSNVSRRKMTGVGFNLYFDVKKGVTSLLDRFPEISKRFWIGDVQAQTTDVKNGAGFVLWVIDGYIHQLEGYVYTDSWPEKIENYELSYIDGKREMARLMEIWNNNSK